MISKKQHWCIAPLLLASLGGLLVASQEAATQPPPPINRAPVGSFDFRFDKSLDMDVKSPGVKWGGNTHHLVRLGRAQFSLSTLSRLTASIDGSVNTFDDVDYDVHVAVFNAQGQLIGTGRTVCSVSRIWAGATGLTPRTLHVDFGVNRDYSQAKYFSVAINNAKVLTPDQWQKQN